MTKSAFVADVLAKMNEHPSDIAQSLSVRPGTL